MGKSLTFCIDFDGTCVLHQFPKVGPDCNNAAWVLKRLVEAGHKIVLHTMRSNYKGTYLDDAVAWFDKHKIPLYGINENPSQKKWTSSPKSYGHIYIDDAALGCPLVQVEGERPYVDWTKVYEMLVTKRIL